MNKYFNTGKTIVIDDQYADAKPLLDALCKKHIPFVYTQGKPNSDFPLPNTDPKDANYYNLIFLDLNLDFKFAGGQIESDGEEKTFKGTHANILNTIIKNENRSFILIIWSNEEENYLEHYLKIFGDPNFTTKKPYKTISLNKSSYFSLTDKGYVFKTDENGSSKTFEENLFNEVDVALRGLEAFKLFSEWDRVVSQSAGDTIDDIMNMVNLIEDESERESYLSKILTCISISYTGNKRYLSLTSNQDKTDAVLHSLTQILNDDLDRNVFLQQQSEYTNWAKTDSNEELLELKRSINSSLLNSKLLIYKPNKIDITGSIYKEPNHEGNHTTIFNEIINPTSKNSKSCIEDLYEKENSKKHNNPEELHSTIPEYIFDRIIPIELNVTPACDIANDKAPFHRIILGFIVPTFVLKCFDLNPDYLVKTPFFQLDIIDNEYLKDSLIVLDLRFLKTDLKENIPQKEYLFSLRTNLINDIQTKLAAHVSRLGVLSI